MLRYRFTDGTLLMADPRASYDGNTHSMFAWVRRDRIVFQDDIVQRRTSISALPTYQLRALVLRYRFTDGTLLMADPRALYDGNTSQTCICICIHGCALPTGSQNFEIWPRTYYCICLCICIQKTPTTHQPRWRAWSVSEQNTKVWSYFHCGNGGSQWNR